SGLVRRLIARTATHWLRQRIKVLSLKSQLYFHAPPAYGFFSRSYDEHSAHSGCRAPPRGARQPATQGEGETWAVPDPAGRGKFGRVVVPTADAIRAYS